MNVFSLTIASTKKMTWTFNFSRILLPWIIAWVIVFPLIHVHPDVDHAHGASHHSHGGTFHSVLSQDLPCENQESSHDQDSTEESTSIIPKISHSHFHHLGHPEFSFSVLTHSKNLPKSYKTYADSLKTDDPLSCPNLHGFSALAFSKEVFSEKLFVTPIFSRPPPILFS